MHLQLGSQVLQSRDREVKCVPVQNVYIMVTWTGNLKPETWPQILCGWLSVFNLAVFQGWRISCYQILILSNCRDYRLISIWKLTANLKKYSIISVGRFIKGFCEVLGMWVCIGNLLKIGSSLADDIPFEVLRMIGWMSVCINWLLKGKFGSRVRQIWLERS